MNTNPANDTVSNLPGSRYVSGRDLAEVAADVRRDIAASIKAGDLPAGVRCSVRLSRYSMGQSLDIKITALPADILIHSIRRIRDDIERPHAPITAPHRSANATRLVAALEGIAARYNHVRGERSTFHLSVTFDTDLSNLHWREIRAALEGAGVVRL